MIKCRCPEPYPQYGEYRPSLYSDVAYLFRALPAPVYLMKRHTGACRKNDELIAHHMEPEARMQALQSSGTAD
jgi:hypothetical protein